MAPKNDDKLAEMVKKMRELEAENEKLKAAAKTDKGNSLTLKVSEKGALSLYGLGRFPVTLYRSQWERLLSEQQVTAIKTFIEAHSDSLIVKSATSTIATTPTNHTNPTTSTNGVAPSTATAPNQADVAKRFPL